MAKKEASETFKLEESLHGRLSRLAYSCDVSKSKLITDCILLSLPAFEENPALVGIIQPLRSSINKNSDK